VLLSRTAEVTRDIETRTHADDDRFPAHRQKQGAGPTGIVGAAEETGSRSARSPFAQVRAPDCPSAARLLWTSSGNLRPRRAYFRNGGKAEAHLLSCQPCP
jgi:hypothetical protein